MIGNTATKHAPWIAVPADHKWFARAVIGSAIVATLETLNLTYPKADAEIAKEYGKIRKMLEEE